MEGQGGRDSLVWSGTTTAWWDGGASIGEWTLVEELFLLLLN